MSIDYNNTLFIQIILAIPCGVPNYFCTSIKAMALVLVAFIFSVFLMIPASSFNSASFSSVYLAIF
jgi:hypothetical protein